MKLEIEAGRSNPAGFNNGEIAQIFSGTFGRPCSVSLYVNGGFTLMRILNKLSIGAALFGSIVLAFAGAAQADEHWDRDHYRDHDRGYHHEHERIVEHRVEHRYIAERPVYVHERPPVIVERPVMMAPPVVYAPPAPSGVNLNFNIPLN
jgi:hypothetical protein